MQPNRLDGDLEASPSDGALRRLDDPNFILLLEDDLVNAHLVRTVIEEDLAVTVRIARDGLAALAVVSRRCRCASSWT